MKIVKPSVDLLTSTDTPSQFLELAGRTCYKSEDKITCDSADKFVKMINKRGHESVVEHASATVRIVCDRGVSHEIVRHRIASFSQESTRYCNYGKDKFGKEITVIEPPNMTEDQYFDWKAAMVAAEHFYFKMLDHSASPQIARSILPNSLKTEIVCTMNFRAWSHFFNLRLDASAHPQIRQIAYLAFNLIEPLCPPVFEQYRDKALKIKEDGLVV